MIQESIVKLVQYGLATGLVEEEDFQKIQGRTGLACTIRSSSVMHHAKDIYPRKNM